MRKSSFAFGVAVFAAVGVAAWFFVGSPARRSEAPRPEPAASTTGGGAGGHDDDRRDDALPAHRARRAASPSAGRLQRDWTAGVVRRWLFDAATDVDLRKSGGASMGHIALRMRGTWEQVVAGRDGDLYLVRHRLHLERFEPAAGKGATIRSDEIERMRRLLERPFYASYDARGRVEAVHVTASAPVQVASMLGDLAAAVQLTLPPAKGASDWKVEEHDNTGDYVAHYRLERGPPLAVVRTVDRYVRIGVLGGIVPAYQPLAARPTGRARFELGGDGWPEVVDVRSALLVAGAPPVPEVAMHRRLHLERTGGARARVAAQIPDDYKTYALADPEAFRAPNGPNEAGPRIEDPRAALESLRSLARKGHGAPEDDRALRQVLEQATALVRQHPAMAAAVGDLVREDDVPDWAARSLVGALRDAGNAAGQRELIRLARSRARRADFATVSIAALGMSKPSHEAFSALTELVDAPEEDVSNTAALALGNLASEAKGAQREEANRAVGTLLDRYANAATDEERMALLEALGNAGDPRVMPLVEVALQSPNPLLRAAATRAVRFVPDPQADAVVQVSLAGDPAPIVRKAAVFAAGYRPLAVVWPALAQALQVDTDASVRSSIVATVGPFLIEFPAAVDAFAWTAQNDPDPAVREAAAAHLQHYEDLLAELQAGEDGRNDSATDEAPGQQGDPQGNGETAPAGPAPAATP